MGAATLDPASRLTCRLECGSRALSLAGPRVMGILNLTPDSFSDGGRFSAGAGSGTVDLGRVRAAAEEMLAAGADILDIGGESTRPGAAPVAESEELGRVMPAIEALLELDTILSVDTRKAGVARAALAAGVQMINDVSALDDPLMLEVLAQSSAAVCLMHMQGEPATMQQQPQYDDVVGTVRDFLEERVARCVAAGIGPQRICIDPGFGFGKRLTHNLTLLRGLASVRVRDLPILVGLSRKRMIGDLTGRGPEQRLAGSVAAALLAVEQGANIVRVHDVAATVDALKVLDALTS
ncbi:MAG: dihydropteroate synthase [Pseudomonadales bacterium]|nr:dihydropteroate synthase [Pseudomonadales bacterium]